MNSLLQKELGKHDRTIDWNILMSFPILSEQSWPNFLNLYHCITKSLCDKETGTSSQYRQLFCSNYRNFYLYHCIRQHLSVLMYNLDNCLFINSTCISQNTSYNSTSVLKFSVNYLYWDANYTEKVLLGFSTWGGNLYSVKILRSQSTSCLPNH